MFMIGSLLGGKAQERHKQKEAKFATDERGSYFAPGKECTFLETSLSWTHYKIKEG
jgi:hypothetical protein